MADPGPDIDALVSELKRTVEQRRRSGDLDADLDEELESRFASLKREAASRQDFDPLTASLGRQRAVAHFSRNRIVTESRIPAGSTVHRAAGAAVRRQVDGLLDQMQQFADAVLDTTEMLGSMLGDPPFHHHDDIRGDLDMVSDRVVELERARVAVDVLARRMSVVERDARGSRSAPALDWGHFAAEFRGSRKDLLAHYAPLADRLALHEPVVDIGCGDGDLLQLLTERGVSCWGVEVDEALTQAARDRGFEVRHGDGREVLAEVDDKSLGAVVLLQVVEHLDAASLPELIASVHRSLRSGGVLVMETPNPQSLYVHAHSFWLDPSHVRPLHPLYLEFLCREVGFGAVEIAYDSPVPEHEQLELLPDDGSDLVRAMNRNLMKLNAALFGPQDSVIVATA